MLIFEIAPDSVQQLVNQVAAQYHAHLGENGVVVKAVFAKKYEDDVLVHGLMHSGHQAAGTIRIISKRQRIHVNHDAELCLDFCFWEEASEQKRIALIDHELNHLVLARDKEGKVKRTDLNHPVLKCIKDDYALTGFFLMAQRHGENAVEYESIGNVAKKISELVDGPLATGADASEQPAYSLPPATVHASTIQ
jgi:hypothetical protein